MKTTILSGVLILFSVFVNAGEVTKEQATEIATQWLLNQDIKLKRSAVVINSVNEIVIQNKKVMYMMHHNMNGFVVVAADDRVMPVLGYSDNYDINNVPPAFTWWMEQYKVQLYNIIDKDITLPKKSFLDNKKREARGLVDPLLTSNWSQSGYYNDSCPENVPCGCVATAMGQVMNYWEYPYAGSHEHSYFHRTYGEQQADFAGAIYDYSSMPDVVGSANAEVAKLLYHCGVSVNMNYGPSGSGTVMNKSIYSMIKYFDYSAGAEKLSRPTYPNWENMLKSEIDAGRPLIYSGGSHAWVCDGYNDSLFHMNWGWGGSYDGWFILSDLTPASSDFTSGQDAFFYLYPSTMDTACTQLYTSTKTSGNLSIINYPYNYPNGLSCEWLMQPSGASRVGLNFVEFNTVQDQDLLNIYDGINNSAPLLASLSGDSIPQNVISTGGDVYIEFITNDFTTDIGWSFNYTSIPEDVGITEISAPISYFGGSVAEEVIITIKNFGLDTLTNIPVEVDVLSPTVQNISTTYTDTLDPGESATFTAGVINTQSSGTYNIVAYTDFSTDGLRTNDTAYTTPYIYSIDYPIYPFTEDFYFPPGQMENMYGYWDIQGDFNVMNQTLEQWVQAWVVDELPYNNIALLKQKIGPMPENSWLMFDYRIMELFAQESAPYSDTLGVFSILISNDNQVTFDTVMVIDSTNHVVTDEFVKIRIPLDAYVNDTILVKFHNVLNNVKIYNLEIDNIVVATGIDNNSITATANDICENDVPQIIDGSDASGGMSDLSWLWQESSDGNIWSDASGQNTDVNYSTPSLTSDTKYRRMVLDTAGFIDTSLVVDINVYEIPNVDLGNDTIINTDNSLFLDAGVGYISYLWSDMSTDQSIVIDTTGYGLGLFDFWIEVENEGCKNRDSIAITFDISTVINDIDGAEVIYPQPANDYVIIPIVYHTAIVYSMSGSILEAKSINGKLDVRALSPGTYILHLAGESKTKNHRLLIR